MTEPLVRTGGGVTVTIGANLASESAGALATLRADDVAGRLAAADASLWGPDAAAEAGRRLGWLALPRTSRALLGPLSELAAELRKDGFDRVVLAGMGGSSLAPEVICAVAGVPLVTVDTTDPGQVAAALVELPRTVVVVSSKSGGTLETDSHHRAFRAAFIAAGLDPAEHIVVVTDPESPLEMTANDLGVRAIFRADPNVGGRYSALTAFGLVPSALAGADVGALLDEAEELAATLSDADGPGVALGAALGGSAASGRDKLVLVDADPRLPGFGDWAEQLVAESTGKQGRGLLPVVVGTPSAPGVDGPDRLVALLDITSPPPFGLTTSGRLGAQFLLWEYATAVAGRVLEIDPFDQPNVQESKDNTGALLERSSDGPLPEGVPAFVDGLIAGYGDGAWLGSAHTVPDALAALLGALPVGGYLAVMAYLDRLTDTAAPELRDALAARTPAAVTFGWAPRFLHSTGQYHKGGPQNGVFLQLTADSDQAWAIPDRSFDFARLQRAQALGDAAALAGRGRPVLRLHLARREDGLAQLLSAVRAARD